MTLRTNDFSLKSWLKTLRYSIEYYEDFCDCYYSNNNNNNSSSSTTSISSRAVNIMSIDDDLLKRQTNENEDVYMNIWECTQHHQQHLSTLVPSTSPIHTVPASNSSLESLEVENLSQTNDSFHSISKSQPIYENLPLTKENLENFYDTLSESSEFDDEEVCSTIQYLENVLDSLETNSDDCIIKRSFEEDIINGPREKLTESSSSFEEFLTTKDELSETGSNEKLPFVLLESPTPWHNAHAAAAAAERTNSSFHGGVFTEEFEPVLPQEEKPIPKPRLLIDNNKKNVGSHRFSTPILILDQNQNCDVNQIVTRPQSFPIYSNNKSTSVKTNKPSPPRPPRRHLITTPPSPSSSLLRKKIDFYEEQIRKCSDDQSQIINQSPSSGASLKSHDSYQNLHLNFAQQVRVSTLFDDDEQLKDLDDTQFEISKHNNKQQFIYKEDGIIKNLKENCCYWLIDLMYDYLGEMNDIMEEKELLKSLNQVKDKSGNTILEPGKFPVSPTDNDSDVEEEEVEIRNQPAIRRTRESKTTDFDLGRFKKDSNFNAPKRIEIRGVFKIKLPADTIKIINSKDEYLLHENDCLYTVEKKTKRKFILKPQCKIKEIKQKDYREIELKDGNNLSYTLYFESIKDAKNFLENETFSSYVPADQKVTIMKTLRWLLGRRSSREILERKGIYKNEPIFGNTLADIYYKTGYLVPDFINRVIGLIERSENIKSLGLYRTSGNLAIIQKIRLEVDNGKMEILNQFAKDPDVLTGSLKMFFRELKEPLIPCEVCEEIMDITRTDTQQLTSKNHQKIKTTLRKYLHEANLETFNVLIRHLLEVVKYKEFNKMDAYNLAVCWGPSMIFSQPNLSITTPTIEFSKDIVTQSHDATRLLDFLIGYYEIFPDELINKRPESFRDNIFTIKRQESRDSFEYSDSSSSNKALKKSASSQSLSVDEVIKKLTELIEYNLNKEGLYKKTGSTDRTNKIIKKLNKKKVSELDKYKNDIYDIADALKRYLRDSQEYLVHRETVNSINAICGSKQNYMEQSVRQRIISKIEEEPKRDSLIYLLRHLGRVSDNEMLHKVNKTDLINIWTNVLNHQNKIHPSNEMFAKFLITAIDVFNENLPDVIKVSIKDANRAEFLKDLKQHQQERDRNSRYDNVDEISTDEKDDKTEQTKL